MTFKIENTEYRIEFRHINRATTYGGRKLRKTGGFKGITTCAVVFYDPAAQAGQNQVVAIETVFCSDSGGANGKGDQFSKEGGRIESLTRAVVNCVKVPRHHISPLLNAYKSRGQKTAGVLNGEEVSAVKRAG